MTRSATRSARVTALAAALLALVPLLPAHSPALLAQAPHAPNGIWWSAAVGAGGAYLTCDLCSTDRDVAPAVRVAAGGSARPGLRVGATASAWSHEDGDVRESVLGAGLLAVLHPRPRRPFHLLGGLGWSGYRAGDFHYDAVTLTVGAGWDFPLSGSWTLTNQAVLDAASFGRLENDGRVAAREVSLSVLRLEVGLRRR